LEIVDFIWLDEIVAKLEWKHGIRPEEIVEVFDNRPRFGFVEKGDCPGENLYTAFGQTAAGRYLSVLFIYKQDQQALIISAHEMTKRERQKYGRK
jgi:uncharacterized DUF497 family protein